MLNLEEGITVLSLFDGMSCGMIALQRAGIKVKAYYASEIDKPAMKVAKHNWSDITHIGDVTKVFYAEGWLFTQNGEFYVGKIDLLIGGSPYQGFSFAGKQLNFSDPRSKLFFEYVRLLRESEADYFMLENVVMKHNFQDTISELMHCSPILIHSDLVSAQTRKRLYWTNIPFMNQPKNKELFWDSVFEENANCFYYTQGSFNWIFKSEDRKAKYKEYKRTDKVKMQMIEASHYKGYSNQRCFGIIDNKGTRYISPLECERLQTVPDNYTQIESNSQRYKMLGNGWTVDVIAHLFEPLKYVI